MKDKDKQIELHEKVRFRAPAEGGKFGNHETKRQ